MFKAQTIAPIVLLAASLPALAQLIPSAMKPIAHVDPRFQSYNIEMVEVIGGRFWKPYASAASHSAPPSSANGAAAGLDPNLFEQRTPADLANPRLRMLAAALGSAYVRVSGTWANNLYVQESDSTTPATPPKDFGGTLTHMQWKGVVDFARAVNAGLVTSFAVSAGTRDAQGV